ncbi:hypothetical protein F5Y12DRAFT_716330 [Xylaria sp. FL1777]|nr:hypothetical protein F5Y12DRAFT_716330 [Xylaria sp. FL1777]
MAALIRGLVLLGKHLLRVDFLYVLIAQAYFPRNTNVAGFLDGNTNPRSDRSLLYPKTAIIRRKEAEAEPPINVATSSVFGTETITSAVLMEFITGTIAQSTASTQTITIQTSEGATARTTATSSIAIQSTGKKTFTSNDSLDCNFPLLYMGASLLPSYINVTATVDLDEWEPAARQLSELRRLLTLHREALIQKHGSEEFERLHADLRNLIEQPIKYGCSMLKSLQRKLLELNAHTTGLFSALESRSILASLLQELETKLLQDISGGTIHHLLPSWVREAPELRSENCPNQDCLKIGEASIDIVTINIPYKLLVAG